MPGQTRGQGYTYVTVSKGKLVVRQPDGTKAYYDSWSEANLVGIHSFFDEKFGNDKWKLTLNELNGDTIILQFTGETWYAVGFFERIMGCRLDLPIEIGVTGPKEDAGKPAGDETRSKTSFCYLRQEGQVVKKDDTFPRPTKIKTGKKEVLDHTKTNARIEEIVKHLYAQGVKDTSQDYKQAQVHHEQPAAAPDDDGAPPPQDEDLPF